MEAYWKIKRKEQRVALKVPVLLLGADANGDLFEENTYTEDVSKTGALILTKHILPIGCTIFLKAFKRFESSAKVRMIWRDHRNQDYYKLGIEFEGNKENWIIH